jgi:hypothetical protein
LFFVKGRPRARRRIEFPVSRAEARNRRRAMLAALRVSPGCLRRRNRPRRSADDPSRRLAHALTVGIMSPIGKHSFGATGITAYLTNGSALEHPHAMAAHESPRTTKLYDRTKERLTQDEVERIGCDVKRQRICECESGAGADVR